MASTPNLDGASGERAKTCDASGMVMIHRVFRVSFAEAPDLVRGVRDGDRAHAEVVARHLTLLSGGVHAHHEGEDERLWSALEERAPGCALHVARMKQQHRAILTPLGVMDAAIPAWRGLGTAVTAAPLLDALDRVNAALAVPLPDEEATIVPVMEYTITEKEIEWFAEHGRKATPKGYLVPSLGMLLAAQPDGGQQLLGHEFPAPVRWLWRGYGQRRYARYRRALTGSRP